MELEIKKITSEEASMIIDKRKPLGCFYTIDKATGKFVGIDNSTGDAFTEEFYEKDDCIKWLNGYDEEEEEETVMLSKEDKMKNAFAAIFDSLCDAENDSIKKDFADKIDDMIKSNHMIKDMENFDVFINYKLDNILRFLVNELNPGIDRDKAQRLYFLYRHYQYLDSNLSGFVKTKEGSGCSVDKSRWLIKRYREYILDEKLPDMEREERCYWKPKFGTGQEWMDLCDGLVRLYYGNPEKYLKSLNALIQYGK